MSLPARGQTGLVISAGGSVRSGARVVNGWTSDLSAFLSPTLATSRYRRQHRVLSLRMTEGTGYGKGHGRRKVMDRRANGLHRLDATTLKVSVPSESTMTQLGPTPARKRLPTVPTASSTRRNG